MSENIKSDGGKNSFYEIPNCVNDVDDLCEFLGLNFAQGNILKSLWSNKGRRHSATNPLREAKKRKHYADRELKRIEGE
jgi:hypothetical protein